MPVGSGITKWVYRHISQEVCPWNVSFAKPVREPAFAARAMLVDKDARTLAQDMLAMDDDAFRAAFRGSAMKRATLAGLKRNARAVLVIAD